MRKESLRSDACVELATDTSLPSGISLDSVGAGRCAIYIHRGPQGGMAAAYQRIFGTWLPGSGKQVGDRPCMETCCTSPLDSAPAGLLTDLCVPLRAASAG